MKDLIGVEIKAGDYVAYSVTAGRSGVLHVGKVLEIVQRPEDYYHPEPYEKAKIVIVEGSGSAWLDSGTPEVEEYLRQYPQRRPKPKITYIEFPERIVVVNHYVPKPKKEAGPQGA